MSMHEDESTQTQPTLAPAAPIVQPAERARGLDGGSAGLLVFDVLLAYLVLHILYDAMLVLAWGWPPILLQRPEVFVRFFLLQSGPGPAFLVHIILFIASWIAAFAVGRRAFDLSARACIGLFILLYPFVQDIYDIVRAFETVLDTGSVAPAITRSGLYATVIGKGFRDMLIPAFGVLLVFGSVPGLHAISNVPGSVSRALARVGVRVHRSIWTDSMHGLWISAVTFVLAVIASTLANRVATTGEESQVFSQMTVDLVFLVSLAAGVGEEFIYRGILFFGLLWVVNQMAPDRGWDRGLLVAAAIFVQALLFGLVHYGYGNLSHIIVPALFGIVMGVVVLFFGLWPAIIAHVIIDIYAFTGQVGDANPGMYAFAGALFFLSLAMPIVYFGYHAAQWWAARKEAAEDGSKP